jgi:CRISPR type III-A-associated RAMP protein Csm4
MAAALLVRLRPMGPWRIGPDSGDRDRVDRIYHSDALYSAVCAAMANLGALEQWLDATARAAEPAVRFSSCFPFHRETLYIVPPKHLWPPPPSSRVRWKGARFVPLSAVEDLVGGRALNDEQWVIDGASESLIPASAPAGPGLFRVAVRSSAAVDRGGAGVSPHSAACLEFAPGNGLWFVAEFADDAAREKWRDPVAAAIRLLADSGFGGERSLGWGRAQMPEIGEGNLPELLLRPGGGGAEAGHWMLSLFHPGAADSVDWQRGNYSLITRTGRTESAAGWGELKKPTRMVAEGSVLVAAAAPRGAAPDVRPDGFEHPVYRAGFAVSIPVPLRIAP